MVGSFSTTIAKCPHYAGVPWITSQANTKCSFVLPRQLQGSWKRPKQLIKRQFELNSNADKAMNFLWLYVHCKVSRRQLFHPNASQSAVEIVLYVHYKISSTQLCQCKVLPRVFPLKKDNSLYRATKKSRLKKILVFPHYVYLLHSAEIVPVLISRFQLATNNIHSSI